MFENFFKKPEAKKEEGDRGRQEQITGMGERVLEEESNLKIKPERSGGYMLCTVLAMALAMGLAAGKAEAQVRGIGPQGHGLGGQIAGEIFHQGVSGVNGTIDRSQNAKMDKIENDYVVQLTRLEDEERQLDHQYAVQKRQLSKKGTVEDFEILERNFKSGKAKIAQIKVELQRQYYKQIGSAKIKKGITEAIFQGIKGW